MCFVFFFWGFSGEEIGVSLESFAAVEELDFFNSGVPFISRTLDEEVFTFNNPRILFVDSFGTLTALPEIASSGVLAASFAKDGGSAELICCKAPMTP